jgi:hypothetical protein
MCRTDVSVRHEEFLDLSDEPTAAIDPANAERKAVLEKKLLKYCWVDTAAL